MRLRRLDLTRYGRFTDYSIDFGAHEAGTPDIHIVYGLNEAGKSTSLSAYLDLLFGIEHTSKYNFLHQYAAMQIGGCLEFDGADHELKRVKQRTNSLLDRHDRPVNEALLSIPLAGLTRDTYRMMFSLDDQTLEDGGNAILQSKGDLGELLFSASAGLADIGTTLAKASEEADEIYKKRASSTRIAGLKRQLADLKARRDGIDTLASAHANLVAALKQAEYAYEAAMSEKGTASARYSELTRVLRAFPLASERSRLKDELAGYDDVLHPPTHWVSELPRLMTDETRLQTLFGGIDQRTARLVDEIDGIEIDERILRFSDRIQRLAEASARFSTAEQDLPRRRASLAESDATLVAILATLGRISHPEPGKLLLPASTTGALRDLIEQRSGLEAALQAAEREAAAAVQARDRAVEEKVALENNASSISDLHAAAVEAVLSRMRQSDHQARRRIAEASLVQHERHCREQFATLAPWSGDGVELRLLSVPDQRQIERWRSTAAAIDKRRADHAERIRDLVTQQRDGVARIEAIHAAAGSIDDAEAVRIRRQRDDAWADHLAALDTATAAIFAERLQADDALSEARLAKVQDVVELRALTAAGKVTAAGIKRQEELLAEADSERAELAAQIRAPFATIARPEPGTSIEPWLGQIERWLRCRDDALSAWDRLQDVKDDIARAKAEAEHEFAELSAAMKDADVAFGASSLSALVQLAENVLAAHAAQKGGRTAADKELRERDRDLASRKQTLDQARATAKAWDERWKTVLEGTWFADQAASPGAVREILDTLADLPAVIRERDDLHRRIETMERDQQALVAELDAILGELEEHFDASAALEAAKELANRHGQAIRQRDTCERKEAELRQLRVERERLKEDIELHSARRSELTSFFDVDTLAEVGMALERHAARVRIEERVAELGAKIMAELRVEPLEAALDVLSARDLTSVEGEAAELATRIDDLDERTKELFAERSRAADRLNAIGGDDAVARIEAERKTVLMEIEDCAVRYLRLTTGAIVAERALRAYRDKHRSSMMSRASEAFRLITRDEYTGLAARPEKDRETLIGLSRQGGSKLAADMSKGTRFQLYLALRLAGYEEFAAARPSVPFVADDIMETFDEPRSEEVFRLLAEMGKIGQVIYLTHHRHICDIARQVVPSVRIHELRV